MNKWILIILALFTCTLSAYASAYSDMAGLQNPLAQINLMQQQQFRQEEYNEFKDMKQQKDARNRKLNLQNEYNPPATKPQSTQNNQNIQLIRNSNGQLILKQIGE